MKIVDNSCDEKDKNLFESFLMIQTQNKRMKTLQWWWWSLSEEPEVSVAFGGD